MGYRIRLGWLKGLSDRQQKKYHPSRWSHAPSSSGIGKLSGSICSLIEYTLKLTDAYRLNNWRAGWLFFAPLSFAKTMTAVMRPVD
jgi:hypothetical protein